MFKGFNMLLMLSGLLLGTSHAASPILPGALKYNAQSHQALPLDGVSLIMRVPKQQYARLNLNNITALLAKPFAENNLEHHIAFVSDNYYHVTTFDLINLADRDKLESAGYNYLQVKNDVIAYSQTFTVDHQLPPMDATIVGLFTYKRKYLSLKLQLSEADLEKYQSFRTTLNQHLIDNVPGYDLVHGEDWAGNYKPHISLAYVVMPIESEKHAVFDSIVEKANQQFVNKPFLLEPGILTAFSDMDHYQAMNFQPKLKARL